MDDGIVGFIGLGNMGLPMASNLAKAGFTVKGYDVSAEAMEKACATLQRVDTLTECVSDCNIIFMMLPNGAIVLEVLSQILTVRKSPVVLIDCSTIDINDARKAHRLSNESGYEFFDAPVSGGVRGATEGTLTAMIGGDENRLNNLTPYLEPLFKNTVYCGAAGNGQAAKICNNMLLATSMIGVCESFNLADKLGLSATTLFNILSTSTGSCWSVNSYCPVTGVGPESPADNHYQPGFSAAMMLKDMNLMQSAADDVQVATPMGTQAQQLYQRFVDNGSGAEDFSGIIRFLQTPDSSQ